ncbi:MAG: transposase [Limnochordia bacterium]
MFRQNINHRQTDLFNTASCVDPRIRKQLEKSWAPLFYEHVFCKIDEKPFAQLYVEQTGRPNFPVNILLGLEILAAFKDYTVEEMLEQFHFNYQVQWALGIRNIGECPLAERTVYYFRERLYLHALRNPGKDDLIYRQFQAVTQHLVEFMGLTTHEMRMDSTMLMSNIRKAGKLSLAYDVLCKALKAIPPELLPPELAEVLKPEYKTKLLYRTKARELSGRFQEMLRLCSTLLERVADHHDLKQHEAIRNVERFLQEKGEFDSESQEWVGKKPTSASNHLQSAHDPDATCRKKGDEVHVGYVANIAETCSDDNPVQIIADYALEKNNVADQTMAHESIPYLASAYGVEDLYVDGGYSGESVNKTASDCDVRMYYTNMTGKESGKIPVTEFVIDGDIVTQCPSGHCPVLSVHDKETGVIITHFDKEICQACPLVHSCPARPGKVDFCLRITPKQRVAAETRKQIQDDERHRINTSKRAAIEGTNSALKRSHGVRKLRVRRHHRCRIIFGLKMMARNFKQLLRFATGDVRRSIQDARRRKAKLAPTGAAA